MRLDVESSPGLTRRAAIAGALAMGSAVYSPKVFAQGAKALVLAEPVHNLGYAPVYLAVDQGLFKSRGLDVSLVVATNGAHVTALVSGQVWGNIGGPESDAMANVGKADPLRTICNLVRSRTLTPISRPFLRASGSRSAGTAARRTCSADGL
jgi:NitT/TauT family transport system substrate-binding protein